MKTKGRDHTTLARAMRAVTVRDICLSLGLAAVVMTLTSVIGSI
jgi:hypothetical protein